MADSSLRSLIKRGQTGFCIRGKWRFEVRKPVRPKRRRSPAEVQPDLDQRVFFLDTRAHKKLLAMLDNPAKPTKELRALMNRKPPWES
jgi:Protein of unknown function (DUF1778)